MNDENYLKPQDYFQVPVLQAKQFIDPTQYFDMSKFKEEHFFFR